MKEKEEDVFYELDFSKFRKKYFGCQETVMAVLWYG
jgi:hypothetical protein